jgi:hypothetical protein
MSQVSPALTSRGGSPSTSSDMLPSSNIPVSVPKWVWRPLEAPAGISATPSTTSMLWPMSPRCRIVRLMPTGGIGLCAHARKEKATKPAAIAVTAGDFMEPPGQG